MTLSGWAIDRAAGAGNGVDAIHVYVYPSDASGISSCRVNFQRSRVRCAAAGCGRSIRSAVRELRLQAEVERPRRRSLSRGGLCPQCAYRSVAAHRSCHSVPPPAMAMDSPAADATVQQPFVVSGWAIDRAAGNSAGVDAVHVYAYPRGGAQAYFLGVAQHGLSRPDIAGLFGQRFAASGYTLTASGLPAGAYDLVAYARSTITGSWQASQRPIIVPQPAMAIDAPGHNAQVQQPFSVTGWAIDRASAQGSGVDGVHVYAYPAAGGAPVFLGAASVGLSRPDIGGLFGQQFTSSGYALSASGLPGGQYVVAVYAHSTVTGSWQYMDRQILAQ